MRNIFKVFLLSIILLFSNAILPINFNHSISEVSAASVSIETNLEDGLITKADRQTFDLFAKDANGDKIATKNIIVTNNEEEVAINWDDSDKTSYTIDLNIGINNIIVAIELEGDVITKEYTITRQDAADGDTIGQYVFALEGFSIGIDHIIEPVLVDVKKGSNAAHALDKELLANGFKYDNTGSLDSSFYLSVLYDGSNKVFKKEPKVPEVLKEKVVDIDELGYFEDSLGEFDFATGSGWMYSVNNNFPNVGFADYYLKDKDVMRVQFTTALGADLGGGRGNNFFALHNKDALTKEIAKINSSENKKEYLENIEIKKAYDEGLQSLYRIDAVQADLDKNLLVLSAKISEYEKLSPKIEKLEQAIITAEKVDLTNRMNSTINIYQTVIEESKAALSDSELSEEKIGKILDNLAQATERLDLVKNLENEIKTAEEIDLTDKSEETVDELNKVISIGKSLLKQTKLTEKEVKEATENINQKVKKLQDKVLSEEELAALTKESINQAVSYAENNFPDYTDNKPGNHSDYWMFSALWGAGYKDLENEFAWKGNIKPSAPHTFWEQKLSKANGTSNEDAGTIIGSVILDYSPYDFGTQNVVADLEAKQKEDGSFFTIWGESWAMIALELVNSETYDKDKHINHILSLQDADGLFGDADSTGWMLTALAPYTSSHPNVKEAVDKSISYIHQTYKETGKLPGMKWGENSNAITSIHMGLAANGENLLSGKWTYSKNIIEEFIEDYQLDNGSFAWQKDSTIGAIDMATEQVILSLATIQEQESIFTQLKAEKNIVNTTELKELVSKIGNIDTTNKTEESIEKLEQSIESAKETLANDKATQEEINRAIIALKKAKNELTEIQVDFSDLENILKIAKKLDTTGKTKESIEELNQAIEASKEILANDKVKQEDVDKTVKTLKRAMNDLKDLPKVQSITKLTPIEVPYGTVEAEIGLPEKIELNLDNNTSEKVTVEWKLETGEGFNGEDPGIYTFKGLYNLPENVLGVKPEISLTVTVLEDIVNKSDLEGLIISAKNIYTEEKTETSVQNLLIAINKAEEVVNNNEATEEDINQATQNLAEAINNLEDEPIPSVSKEILIELIKQVENKDLTEYTEETVNELNVVLGKALVTVENKKADQKEVDEIMQLLEGALDNLSKKDEPKDEEEKISKNILKSVIQTVKEIDTTEKTEESRKSLNESVIRGEELLSEEVASQEAIDQAVIDILEAINQLVDKTIIPHIERIESIASLEVPFGTKETELDLPEKLTLILSDQTKITTPVKWTVDNEFNGKIPGEYMFIGNYDLPEDVQDDKLEITVSVKVLDEIIEKTGDDDKEKEKEAEEEKQRLEREKEKCILQEESTQDCNEKIHKLASQIYLVIS